MVARVDAGVRGAWERNRTKILHPVPGSPLDPVAWAMEVP